MHHNHLTSRLLVRYHEEGLSEHYLLPPTTATNAAACLHLWSSLFILWYLVFLERKKTGRQSTCITKSLFNDDETVKLSSEAVWPSIRHFPPDPNGYARLLQVRLLYNTIRSWAETPLPRINGRISNEILWIYVDDIVSRPHCFYERNAALATAPSPKLAA